MSCSVQIYKIYGFKRVLIKGHLHIKYLYSHCVNIKYYRFASEQRQLETIRTCSMCILTGYLVCRGHNIIIFPLHKLPFLRHEYDNVIMIAFPRLITLFPRHKSRSYNIIISFLRHKSSTSHNYLVPTTKYFVTIITSLLAIDMSCPRHNISFNRSKIMHVSHLCHCPAGIMM